MGCGNTRSEFEAYESVRKLLFLLLLVLQPAWADEMVLEIIPLNHRLVDDVVPILKPLVTPGGTLTGMNNQLIIKSTPDNIADIKNVLSSLDKSPRRLLISVKQDIGGSFRQREQSISGRHDGGNVDVDIKDPGPREGLVISGGDDDTVVRYRVQDSTSSTDDRNTYTVQATEGYPAFISSGQSVPVSGRTTYVTPGGVVVNDSTEYVDASSGFYVLPRLSGDQVTLLVAPQLTRVSPGKAPVFDFQNVETTATGQIGEWIELGGINQQSTSSGRKILSSSSSSGSESRSILIKVTEIK